MDKRYKHSDHENRIYSLWEKSGAFTPPSPAVDKKKKLKSYCIIMPPPNANDPLHIGHAMFVTVEDIFIRYHRMLNEAVLWLPGADHAGIETQFVFEKNLKKQGKSRFDFDRETLQRMIWNYVQENKDVTVRQMKKLGASADWSRFKFTLDEDIVKLVLDTFKQLYEDKLVYRDLRLVNYCTHCGTAFSDLEVKHLERKTPLYYMKYGPFSLATVRPETKFGDTAVAVNPGDPRYKKWVGHKIEVPGLLGTFRMKVIADSYVDPKFGTGVVKVTPAHDPNDFEIWQRHKNEIPGPKQVIGFDGKLNELTGKYAGLPVEKARKLVVRDLKKVGLLEKVDEDYQHAIGVCYRCGTVIEPLPLPQFFIKVKPLTQKALKALNEKKVRIHGAGYQKVLKHWLENLKDWNVSRQIAWGIRMPVWYSVKKNPDIYVFFLDKNKKLQRGEIVKLMKEFSLKEIKQGLQSLRAPIDAEYVLSPTSPEAPASADEDYLQETDTFDTWFSSAQWPFVALRTSHPRDFERFYPTDVMETAYDILIFWVMRMLMMGLYKTGKVPFKEVYLHGLIRDEKGQKMSKSRGNIINPLDVIKNYGADALRMALVMSTTAGRDSAAGEGKIRGMRNFTNKIWNATRYTISRISNQQRKISTTIVTGDKQLVISKEAQGSDDQIFKQKLAAVSRKVTQQLDALKPGLAAETVYGEFWHWYCDECIEESKSGKISLPALIEGLIVFLKLLHPFVPFVTEVAYQELANALAETDRKHFMDTKFLISAGWPAKSSSN